MTFLILIFISLVQFGKATLHTRYVWRLYWNKLNSIRFRTRMKVKQTQISGGVLTVRKFKFNLHCIFDSLRQFFDRFRLLGCWRLA